MVNTILRSAEVQIDIANINNELIDTIFNYCWENFKAMSASDKQVSKEKIDEQVDEMKKKYPLYTAIMERIPDMELEEVVTIMFLVDSVRWVLKAHAMKLSLIGDDKVTDQMVEEKINEMRSKYANLASILERIHNMDLKETTIGLFGIDAMESLLKLRAAVIVAS
jgi:hypothetical protein